MGEKPESFDSYEGKKLFIDTYDKTMTLWDVDFESIYVDTSFGKVHVIKTGRKEAKPLILLHGFGFGASMWYANIKEFSKGYCVYAVDILGEFNKSVLEEHLNSKEDYRKWMIELLGKLMIKKASFVGHSNGGWHALNIASYCPNLIEKLVLLAPAASVTPMDKQFHMRLMLSNILKKRWMVIDQFCQWFVAKGNSVDMRVFEQFYQGTKHVKWEYIILPPTVFDKEELANISAPTLLMIGTKEVIYNYKKAFSEAMDKIADCKIVTIEGAGHMLPIEKADEVNREILSFLEQ